MESHWFDSLSWRSDEEGCLDGLHKCKLGGWAFLRNPLQIDMTEYYVECKSEWFDGLSRIAK